MRKNLIRWINSLKKETVPKKVKIVPFVLFGRDYSKKHLQCKANCFFPMPPVLMLKANYTKETFAGANCKTVLQEEIKAKPFP